MTQCEHYEKCIKYKTGVYLNICFDGYYLIDECKIYQALNKVNLPLKVMKGDARESLIEKMINTTIANNSK